MTNHESKQDKTTDILEAGTLAEEAGFIVKPSKTLRTIRGNEVRLFDDKVVKCDYSEQEIVNLALLKPYATKLAEAGILIPAVLKTDRDQGTVTLSRLPFGSFPTTSEYFGEGSYDHISPLHAIERFRNVCDAEGITGAVRQYSDNNDYDHFVKLVNKQRTERTIPHVDQFLAEVTRLSRHFQMLPRVVAHRDFTPANIREIAGHGCVMLDFATFGMSTYGADEGRWYVHHVLDKDKQKDILDTTQQLNHFGTSGNLAFLLMVGMRSARECKMLDESSYYDNHLQSEFHEEDMVGFKSKLEEALVDQLMWTSKSLKQF